MSAARGQLLALVRGYGRVMPAAKRAVLAVATNVAHIPGGAAFVRFVTGYDPTLLGPPGLLDLAFVVLSPFAVSHESESSRANA